MSSALTSALLPTPFWIVITFALGVLSAGFVLWLIHRREIERRQFGHEAQLQILKSDLNARQQEIENLNLRIAECQTRLQDKEGALESALMAKAELKATLSQEQKQNQEKLVLLDEAKQQLGNEFKNIANDIFETKQRTFKEQSQAQLDGVLKPLGEKIKDFEKRVQDTYTQESRERFSLIKEVKNLQDLNSRISKDAINLTSALKGESKTQGSWGEIILERVLEKSGLVKGREYEIQASLKNEEGKRLQPDVIVHLPENKDVIIDSKVSLTAYERHHSSDDDEERQDLLKSHLQSIRTHIRQLGDKGYQNVEGIRTLDFILLFVPIEAAFSLAVQEDNELFSDAFDRNIVLVAPSTLLATLRTIQNIWRYEQQNKNAEEIADKAGALYDKFVNFVSDLEDIGSRLSSVQTAYDKAHNKLTSGKGNLVGRAENMRELGAKVSKSLPKNLVEMPLRENTLPSSG